MDNPILFVFIFTLTIHMISTLAYAVRLVGVRTGRLAVSFALFNILVLISRTAHAIQAPLLSKKIEGDLAMEIPLQPDSMFRWLILAASIGTLIGGFLIPTFKQLFTRFVLRFDIDRSIPRVLIHGFSKAGVRHIKTDLKIPSRQNIKHLKDYKHLPKRLIALNTLVISILTVGVFASLNAAYINPALRVTASTLAPIITGLATILLVVFIDPYFSLLTDDVLDGKRSEAYFHKCVFAMAISRFAGTLLAQLLLGPAAWLIAKIASLL